MSKNDPNAPVFGPNAEQIRAIQQMDHRQHQMLVAIERQALAAERTADALEKIADNSRKLYDTAGHILDVLNNRL